MEEASWGQSTDGFQPSHSRGVPSHRHAYLANIPAVGALVPAHCYSTRYGGQESRPSENVTPIAFPAANFKEDDDVVAVGMLMTLYQIVLNIPVTFQKHSLFWSKYESL